MTKFTIYLSLLVFACLLGSSCGNDAIDCSNDRELSEALTGFSDELITASLAFGSDPSASNCNDLRDIYTRWIDSLERVEDCADQAGQGAEFREALNEARQGLDDFTC